MLANVVNAAAVLIGTFIGLLSQKFIKARQDLTTIIYSAVGLITISLGIMMAMRTERILYFAIATVVGAIIGQLLGIERAIENFGNSLHKLFYKRKATNTRTVDERNTEQPGRAFLDSSVLFCVGSMAILGSIQAGINGEYSILLTKSIMDGVMAVLLTAALGWGVGLSVISIMLYQGGLTLLSGFLEPLVSELMLGEITAVGGVMILAIGFSLLGVRKIPAGNFLPALIIVIILALLDPYIPMALKS